jgi:hypothetical protein
MKPLSECEALVQGYLEWLRRGIKVSEADGVCEITTPFLDRHNDHLAIYLSHINNRYVLSDGGYILSDLEMSGVDINTEKRARILATILRGFGVQNVGGDLRIETRREDLARAKHNLLQAMLAINDMFVMAQKHVLSLFLEDVEAFLRAHSIRFVARIKLTGRSGLEHGFDFAVPASDRRPERLLRAINIPVRDTITAFCFAWSDTSQERAPDTEAYAVLNDQERSVSIDLLHALEAYQIQPILWGARERYVEALAA